MASPGAGWGQQLPDPGPLDAGAGRNVVGQGYWSWVGLAAGHHQQEQFAHLKLAQVSLHSPRSLRDCKASTASVRCSFAKVVTV